MTSARAAAAPLPLVERFRPSDLDVFTAPERERFLAGADPADVERVASDEAAWRRVGELVAWELLYRIDPDAYERLIAGERIHPSILAFLPGAVAHAVEVGAGGGRLTLDLAPSCRRLTAIEPAVPLRERLSARLEERGLDHVEVVDGFFDAVPLGDDCADLVVACSAFTISEAHGGAAGLDEMERLCAPGGTVAIIWPPRDTDLLAERGYVYTSFPGEMSVEFADAAEAVEVARTFYPHAVAEIERRGSGRVPYDVLGTNPPRDVAWRRL